MPRKTKDQKELEIKKEKVVKKPSKKAEATSKTKAKKTQVKKADTKKTSTKATKTASKKAPTKTTKTASEKVPTKSTKTSSKKVDSKSAEKKKSDKAVNPAKAKTSKTTKTSKTSNSSKVSKTSTKRKSTKKTEKKVEILEYYDLPYRYNQTVVKVLAQTPNNLFIYWDISDSDRENFKKQYGENFFENTKPVLIVHNDTLNYSFEVEINDFANSWYLHVNDAKSNYRIELGRKPYVKNEKINTDYIYISTSNGIEAPNDRILFDKNQKMVYFRNVKTGKITEKPINTISFIRNMGKIYNIYDLYKELYKDEEIDDIVSNPSSGNPSSNSFSSKFM